MSLKELEREAAQAALNKMLRGGHFDICTVDKILRMTGGVPDARAYNILSTLHCVNYSDMPPRLRLELPRLLQVVLEAQPITYTLGQPVVEVVGTPQLGTG